MKKPVIVLSPQHMPMEQPFEESYTYSNCYNTGAILEAGGIPVIPPYLELADAAALLEQADGLFLTGGADISPERYGEQKLEFCGTPEPGRDTTDWFLLQAALELKKPVLCVCRGAQLANVYFGGTLYQDLAAQRPGSIAHSAYGTYDRETAHSIRVVPDTPLCRLLGPENFHVNSLHHQGIRRLASCLAPMAYSPDGLVESWYYPGRWIRGYQWHPEMIRGSIRSRRITEEFIQAANKC